jgi:hypothetical protein
MLVMHINGGGLRKSLSVFKSAMDGFSVFHLKEFKARTGEFAGWSDGKCSALINDLSNLVRATLAEGLTVFLERSRYLNTALRQFLGK